MNVPVITKQPKINPFQRLAEASSHEERKTILDNALTDEDQRDESLILSIKDISNEPQTEATKKHLEELISKYIKRTYVSTGLQSSSSVHTLDQEAVHDVRKQLLTEFAPVSASEALVIDQAINSYFRSLRLSQIHLHLTQDPKGEIRMWDNQQIINFVKEAGKYARNLLSIMKIL